MMSVPDYRCMEQTAPSAPKPGQTEVWHVDFHMSYEPDSLAPNYLNCQVSRRVPNTDPAQWHMEGVASFDCPPVIVPRVGADLIPYMIYHLDEVKSWLIEEHVRRVFNGQQEAFGPDVAIPVMSERSTAPEPI